MELSDVEVFADQLQARGDARGELLSLELAAERAPSSAEARRLNREAQRIREAHRGLVWPRELADSHVQMRAGFAVYGRYGELFEPGIPIELTISLRRLYVEPRSRLEDCLRALIRPHERGLRLDALRQLSTTRGPPTQLAGLRKLGAIDQIALPANVTEIDAIAALTGLRSCHFGGRVSQAELCSLAPLSLEQLRLHGAVDPVIVPLFGNTLTELELGDVTGPLAPLAGLPWLRSLVLFAGDRPPAVSELASLHRLERLLLPELHESEQLMTLCGLPLRELLVDSLAASLAGELWRLRGLEELEIWELRGGPLDLGSLAGLTKLRKLSLPADCTGGGVLPPSCEKLEIRSMRQRLAIAGNVVELEVDECDPRCVPPAMLANLRRLSITWTETAHDDFLAELPRACPNLEQLSIRASADWRWDDAPAILDALPQLRSFVLRPATNAEIAEIARAFPELCPLPAGLWPRSAGEAPRVSVSVPREPDQPRATEDPGFVLLRSWAGSLRASGDLRGELLELELASELSDDPAEARALNVEAAHLRAREPRLAWPSPLRQDLVLLRGGMPVISAGGWLDWIAPPLELMPTLRQVRLDHPQRLEICVDSLVSARAHGLRLEQLELRPWLHAHSCPARTLARLRDFAELDTLRLEVGLGPGQHRHLPDLRLRSLGLSHHNFDPTLVARFASTLVSLELGAAPTGASLDGLVLPRLEQLVLADGWDVGWALRQPGLRALELSIRDDEQVEQLTRMQTLESLSVSTMRADLGELSARLPQLRHLSLSGPPDLFGHHRREPDLAALVRGALEGWDLRLDLERSSLESLELFWDDWEDLTLELRLPPQCRSLDLWGPGSVILHGSILELGCTAEQLDSQPQLCEGIRRLRVYDGVLGNQVFERANMLEYLELEGDTDLDLWWHLGRLPRLRTVVLHGAPLGRLAELSERLPEVQLFGVDPGVRDPARWPRPPA